MEKTLLAPLPEEESTDEKAPSHRVLVVDDNENCAKTLMWTMEILGHDAKIACDGKTAIALARVFQPALIFLDIGLPEMDGYEICQAMRKEPVLDNTLIVALSGWGQREHRERSNKAGFDYHLVKPAQIETLKKILLVVDKNKP